MQRSRFNLLTPIHDSEDWLLVNLLAGEAELLGPAEGAQLATGEVPAELARELAEKGFLVNPAEEERRYRRAYLDFAASRDTDEVQLFYVPSYACNFACSYCYQDEYVPMPGAGQDAVISAFFAYVNDTFAARKKYVTIFGGEPLLPTAGARKVLERLITETNARGLDLAIVTNGYHLASYVNLLRTARIREVQVTLDGPKPLHDARRSLKGGASTFDEIVAGIDACLAAGLPVNLRSVLDKDNVDGFAELARFAIARGWTDHPLFKTQIGRNYELHHCQAERARLYTRLSLYESLYRLVRRDPEILRFHRPAFSVARFLFDQGALPAPLFDSCPATKTEWAFDYTGHVYPCTANVGKAEEALGTFYPTRSLHADRVEPWEERDVLAIDACRTCASQLACGGGCGAVAKNRTGTITSPDCRPIPELLALGAALYREPAAP